MKTEDESNERPRKYRVNGITFYYRNGKLCAMPSTREKTKKPPTEKQIESREALEIATDCAINFFRTNGILCIALDAYAKLFRKNRLDIFKMINYPVLDAKLLGVDYFPDFFFCKGKLVPPRETRVNREDLLLFPTWEHPDREYGLSNPDDLLMMGYFYESRPDIPLLVMTDVTRGERFAQIQLPDLGYPSTETLHLYLFFCSPDWTTFSDSRYVKA